MHAAGTAAQEATGDLEVWRAVFAAFQDADDVLSAPALGFAHEHALHALRPGPPLHLQHHPGSGVFEAAGQACTPAQVPAPPAQRVTHRRSEANAESSCSGPSRTHQAWRSEGIACGCARPQAPPRNWCLSPMHSAPDAANSRLATAHVHARKRTRSCSRSRSSSVCVRTRAVCSLSVLSQTALACIASLSSTLSAPGADTGQRACAETRVRGVRGQRDERITTCAHEHTQSFGLT